VGVSTEVAGQIAEGMRLHWDKRNPVTEQDAESWAAELTALGLDDEKAKQYFKRFKLAWDSVRKPSRADFCRWVRENSELSESGYVPPERRCGLCDGVGWLPILVPVRVDNWTFDTRPGRIIPGVPIADAPVYLVCVPCACSRGQHLAGRVELEEDWYLLRDRQIAWARDQKDPDGTPKGYWRAVRDWYMRSVRKYRRVEETGE